MEAMVAMMEVLMEVMEVEEGMVVAVPQIQVETLMGLQVQVEILLLLPHLLVGAEGVHLHPLLHNKVDQMDHKVPIFPLSIIEVELQIPELLHKS